MPTGKLCSSRLQDIKKTEREARQQNEVQERQRAQAAPPSPSTTMMGGSEGLGKAE